MTDDEHSDDENFETEDILEEDISSRYKVKIQKTNKDELYQPRCSEIGILPKLPFGMALIGKSGSGKTQCMIHMLTDKYLLKDTFDYIYLFVGVKPDDQMIKALNLPKENIKINFVEEDVKTLCDKMEKTVEKQGFKKTPSVLFIFDDFLNKKKFIKSDTMTKLCTANRHMNISYMLLSQYYKKLSPVIRTNVSCILFFPASLCEVIKLAEEQCPPHMSKTKFIEVVQYATKDPYQFLSINNHAKPDEKLRKGFDKLLQI